MSKGRFGIHGGQYIPETLMHAVGELEEAYLKYRDDPDFQRNSQTSTTIMQGVPACSTTRSI